MTAAAPSDRQELLGIYLNDHLAGATAGTSLAHRLASAERAAPDGPVLTRIAGEIGEDRRALLDIMSRLGIPVRQYKVGAAWVAERVARVKPNRRLLGRSPLSKLIELEMLRLGVEGKAAGWRSLREAAEHDATFTGRRLDPARLDNLLARATSQAKQLEELQVRAAAVFHSGSGTS
jgi:hypothetical protein